MANYTNLHRYAVTVALPEGDRLIRYDTFTEYADAQAAADKLSTLGYLVLIEDDGTDDAG